MWKATALSLFALLSAAHCYSSNARLGVESWDRMLAKLMLTEPQTGTCGDQCYITHGGERRIFHVDSEPIVFPSLPCVTFICRPEGVVRQNIVCRKVDCGAGDQLPIRLPGKCCQQCGPGIRVPGEFEEWMEWNECSTTCGRGLRARRRTCNIGEDATDAMCTGILLDTKTCTEGPCPIDCEWKYKPFEQCSTTCGDGEKSRFPEITQHPQHGGKPCPPFVVNGVADVEPCNLRECPVDCEWEYGEFEECSTSCGIGEKRQYPVILVEPRHGGRPCPAHVLNREPNTMECNIVPCPEDCVWEYGRFRDCSASCGGGVKQRFPRIIRPATNDGEDCPEHVRNGVPDNMDCNPEHCPVDCEWEYEDYGGCSKSCGVGIKSRRPRIIVELQYGGKSCPDFVINQTPDTMECNLRECPVDCEWKYGDFGDCSVTCGGGVKYRYPEIITEPAHDGKQCPQNVIDKTPDQMECKTEMCPMVCGPGETACPQGREFVCIKDSDGDCIPDSQDNCKYVRNPDQVDLDSDDVGDVCDNCPKAGNTKQTDSDKDGVGNECDGDDDNDGIVDQNDKCPTVVNPGNGDGDGDGVGDECDNCLKVPNKNQADIDEDGVGNACDNCRFFKNPKQLETDPKTYGRACTTRPPKVMDTEDDEFGDNMNMDSDKKHLAAKIMEKLLEMYYSS